jgi:hypothetical protein
MMVYSKQSYDDQDDGRILKAAQKQQYSMFPDPIVFINDELKAELGMKTNKDEEEYDAKYCSVKVPMDHEDTESKIYLVKIKKYNTETPEEFLILRLMLNEHMKIHGYISNYEMFMNLAQVMLVGRSLEVFLSERRSQESKNKMRKAKYQMEYTP